MKLSKIMLLMLAVVLMLDFSGCKKSHGQRKESAEEYAELAKKYAEEKYSRTFEIADFKIHDTSFSGEDLNKVMLRDENGVLVNICAKYSTPYSFYDIYASHCAAAKILVQLDYDKNYIESMNMTVVLDDDSMDNMDISPENIKLPFIIAKIPQKPNDANLKAIYDVYEAAQAMGYTDVKLTVGFVKDSSDFDKAIENYRFYGKNHDSEYNGEFYARLRAKEGGLSFEEFKLGLVEY